MTLLAGSYAAIVSGYLALLSTAALRRSPAPEPPSVRDLELVVLVPAHNEAELLTRCLDSLRTQDYPPSRYSVTVIADNCTDDTAGIAMRAGADALVRTQPEAPGKGRALRWAMDGILAGGHPPDAIVVVDADSVAEPALLRALAGRLARGGAAVQADYLGLPENDSSPGTQLRLSAFLLFHQVRFRGRARLGLPCALVGNGMAFSTDLLRRVPWDAFGGVEDLEYSIHLRLSGVRPVFAEDGRVRGPIASAGSGEQTQRLRWEGGRLRVVRTSLPVLGREIVVRRRWDLWDAALDLAVPPLGVLTALVVSGNVVGQGLRAAGLVRSRHLIPWVVALVGVPAHVLLGLRAGRAPASTYRALFRAPALVGRQLLIRSRLFRGGAVQGWQRTARPGEQS